LANAIWRHALEKDMARGDEGKKIGYHREGQFASNVENALEAINADIKSRRAKQDIQGTPTDKPRAEKHRKFTESGEPAVTDKRSKTKTSNRSIGPIGGGGGHSGGGDTYPVLDAGKKKRGMVQLRVSFTPTKLVSARSYEIHHKRTDEKGKPMKDLGRRPLGGKGPTTARALDGQGQKDRDKDFKTLMELKLGYNRLKGLAN